ncbi:hypothetical protein [Arsukibacterium ikkense]|uniref:hypothetical protein n=1 Tax=Arsukibacterium ikkense TaxID=336831 RepID=UPI0006271A33|nr:hypothetical protein [Arsukibacterium ikkense]
MNWPLFWALLLAFGLVIGNVLLLKHAAKISMRTVKNSKITKSEPAVTANNITRHQPDAEKPNTPE